MGVAKELTHNGALVPVSTGEVCVVNVCAFWYVYDGYCMQLRISVCACILTCVHLILPLPPVAQLPGAGLAEPVQQVQRLPDQYFYSTTPIF